MSELGDVEAFSTYPLWSEHLRELLNRPPPMTEADIHETAEIDLDINIQPPIKEEIVAAIKSLQNG